MRDKVDIFATDRIALRTTLAGCGLAVLIVVVLAGIAGVSIFNRARHAARYPGATPISTHYKQRLPYSFRWDNSYHTADPFPKVFNWYSTKFDLGSENRAISNCSQLQGPQPQLVGEGLMSVILCDTPTGRLIYVTRYASLR
jgi:hypothetical protein